jgi:hypothetical protein
MRSRRRILLMLVVVLGTFSIDALAERGGRGRGAVNDEPRGIRVNTGDALPGYTLFAPLTSDTTYLVDMEGRAVRTWKSDYVPGAWVYMNEDGDVLRGGNEVETAEFSGGGQGGRLQRFTFDGELVWDYSFNTGEYLTHHDAALLPNGNVLAIAWERIPAGDVRRAGRRDGFHPEDGAWSDMLVEFEPVGFDDANVVWEWHAWDHLIQNVDPDLPNHGDPSAHPEKIDINGDIVGRTSPPPNASADLFHVNAVAYNAELDQIIISSPNFNELWVIDHSTTTAQAAGPAGDLRYRWGNPRTYGRGEADDQVFGFEHDTKWIPEGFPGGGNMMIFSNRGPGESGTVTAVYEIEPPLGPDGTYVLPDDGPYGPSEPVWSYSDPQTFQATYISGAERLSNGNTLITSGPQGRLFEANPDGKIVWEFWSPFTGNGDTGTPTGAQNPYSIFRAIRIPLDHPAIAGRELAPIDPQPALVSPE